VEDPSVDSALDFSDKSGRAVTIVTIPVRIHDAPSAVPSTGLEIHFSPDILRFDSFEFARALYENFDFKGVRNLLPSVLHLCDFAVNNPVTAGGTGIALSLRFVVAWSLLPMVGLSWMALYCGVWVTLAAVVVVIFLMFFGVGIALGRKRLRPKT